jgi:protein-disulfide isomerase
VKRDSKLAPILAIVGGAIVLVVALVVASQVGNNSNKSGSGNIQVGSVEEMLKGVEQNGVYLGDSKAKLTLVEFSDPQCPYCAKWAGEVFPSLVQDYVKAGKLRIEYRGLRFVDDYVVNGPKDSERQLRLALAAGLQNKLWNVVELEFLNQDTTENTGYATDSFLREIADAVGPDFNVDKALAAADTNAVVPMLDTAKKLAAASFGKKLSTPSFLLMRAGSTKPVKTIVGAQPYATFSAAIDAELSK